MRVALISIVEELPVQSSPTGVRKRRGLMQFGGRSLAERQIAQALELDCERVVCLTQDIPQGHLALQQLCEAGGAQFQLVESVVELSGLVRAADELFVFAEGTLLPTDAVEKLAARPGVLAIAADKGVPAGFERLDADHAWAGLLRGPGTLIERLTDLPSDIEPVAALLRIALQSGARLVSIADQAIDNGTLAIFESEAQVLHAQKNWLRRAIRLRSWFAPGLALADRLAGRYAAKLLAWDVAGWRGAIAVIVLLLIATCLAIFVNVASAYVAIAIGTFGATVILTMSALSYGERPDRNVKPPKIARWAVDLAIIATPLVATLPQVATGTAFALVALIGVMRLAELLVRSPRMAIVGDRIVLCILLALAATMEALVPVTQITALAILGLALVITRKTQR